MARPDDWHKPRNQGRHLTEDEIEQIRIAAHRGEPQRAVAQDLRCSTRTVQAWFARFGAERARRGASALPPPARRPLPDRFYHSNFEPT